MFAGNKHSSLSQVGVDDVFVISDLGVAFCFAEETKLFAVFKFLWHDQQKWRGRRDNQHDDIQDNDT